MLAECMNDFLCDFSFLHNVNQCVSFFFVQQKNLLLSHES